MTMVVDVVTEIPEDHILCKIQRPLFNSEGDFGKLYIYDEHRMIEAEVSIEQEVLSGLFPSDEHKGFAVCILVDDEHVPGACKVKIEALLDEAYWPEW